MSSFTRAVYEPTGRTVRGRAIWRCVGGYRYELGWLGSGIAIDVPDGFETDGPSVPWWALPFIKVGSMIRSAGVHDRMREDRRFSLVEADAFFLAAMEAERTPWLQRELVFLVVRANRSRKPGSVN